jgi:hypothetical protein
MSFEDLLGSLGSFGKTPAQKVAEMNAELAKKREAEQKAQRSETPIPQMRSKTIDGVKYLRAEDVANALNVTKSWSRVFMHITKWLNR